MSVFAYFHLVCYCCTDFCLCVHLCVEDENLCSELSAAEEKDVGHKVCKFCYLYCVSCRDLNYYHLEVVVVVVSS